MCHVDCITLLHNKYPVIALLYNKIEIIKMKKQWSDEKVTYTANNIRTYAYTHIHSHTHTYTHTLTHIIDK